MFSPKIKPWVWWTTVGLGLTVVGNNSISPEWAMGCYVAAFPFYMTALYCACKEYGDGPE